MKSYTLADIEKTWKVYKSKKVLRTLKAGKYQYTPLEGKGIPRIDAIQADIVFLHQVKSFPEFLKNEL